ncbi:hypothetical protein HYX01_03780 [Candidatus Woesearchaeota archaeon]|nr:hypothetical protein [Candidatus Woesearchaeota archaeon]
MDKRKDKQKKGKQKKQKALAWFAIILTALNFILIIGFFIYLYLWVRGR